MFSIRPYRGGERSFVYSLMKENMKRYFSSIPEAWSDEKFHERFSPERVRIVELDGKRAGFFDYEIVDDSNGTWLYWHNVQILPEYHLCGIGNFVLETLIGLAQKSGAKEISGKAFLNNPAYEWLMRHGFEFVEHLPEEMSDWVRKIIHPPTTR